MSAILPCAAGLSAINLLQSAAHSNPKTRRYLVGEKIRSLLTYMNLAQSVGTTGAAALMLGAKIGVVISEPFVGPAIFVGFGIAPVVYGIAMMVLAEKIGKKLNPPVSIEKQMLNPTDSMVESSSDYQNHFRMFYLAQVVANVALMALVPSYALFFAFNAACAGYSFYKTCQWRFVRLNC